MPNLGEMRGRWDWKKCALVVACVFPFLGYWSTGLTDLDEGFYGAVVANMLRTGDWITPHYNGAPWFEKPILTYWLAAPSVMLFGEDFGPRLPSVACTILTALVLYRFFRRHLGVERARVIATAYCGSLLVVGVGHMLMTDAPFVLALTIALTTFYDSITGSPERRSWSAVALGFAVLAKGPVAGLFLLLIAGVTYGRIKELRPNFKGHWLIGSALFALVVGAWYVPCYLQNGDVFVQKFLIEQNLGRFGGGDKAHGVPWWSHPIYFPLEIFFALMPWSFWAMRAQWFRQEAGPLTRYLWNWGMVVLVFFTVSGTKLPHYVLPAMAPFTAITVMAVLERRKQVEGSDFWLKSAVAWCMVVGAFATVVFQIDYQKRFQEIHSIARRLKTEKGSVVQFRTSRSGESDSPTAINDTTHPSFFFYLGREGVLTNEVNDMAALDGTVWVVTRRGRMDEETIYQLVLSGFDPRPFSVDLDLEKFEVWRLEPLLPDGLTAPFEK